MQQKKFDWIFLIIFISILAVALGVLAVLKVDINWYGLLIGIAFLVGLLIVRELAYVRGYEKDMAYDMLFSLFIPAIIGARLFYVIFSGESWTFIEILQIWNGGLSIFGGIIGGFLGLLAYSFIKKRNIFLLTDLVVPVLLLGQAIGRWGNFANQEVYGKVVSNSNLQWFPMAVYINATGNWHYALFFYESVLNFVCALTFLLLYKKVKNIGYFTAIYLIFYGTIRSVMELFRYEQFILTTSSGLPISLITSFCFIAFGIALLTYCMVRDLRRKRNAK